MNTILTRLIRSRGFLASLGVTALTCLVPFTFLTMTLLATPFIGLFGGPLSKTDGYVSDYEVNEIINDNRLQVFVATAVVYTVVILFCGWFISTQAAKAFTPITEKAGRRGFGVAGTLIVLLHLATGMVVARGAQNIFVEMLLESPRFLLFGVAIVVLLCVGWVGSYRVLQIVGVLSACVVAGVFQAELIVFGALAIACFLLMTRNGKAGSVEALSHPVERGKITLAFGWVIVGLMWLLGLAWTASEMLAELNHALGS